ncbi:MAG: ThiF family adenylyltransferase [Acutalibacteraceae bacterium]
MNERFSRTEMLLGEEAMDILQNSRVALFGVGGVGGFVAEALARAGVGHIHLFDSDTVSLSNVNRQIIALTSTLGEKKTEAAKKRILDINPEAKVETFDIFVLPENIDSIDFSVYDYIADAIDTVSGKLAIIEKATAEAVPVISSMGTGNKLDPTKLRVTDISKTSVCPLARVMRYELRKRGIRKLKVLYSEEQPLKPENGDGTGKRVPGSVSFVPSVAGLIIGGEMIKDLIQNKKLPMETKE